MKRISAFILTERIVRFLKYKIEELWKLKRSQRSMKKYKHLESDKNYYHKLKIYNLIQVS